MILTIPKLFKGGNIMELKDWGLDTLGNDIWRKKYQQNNESFDQWLDRVSGGDKDVKQLIIDKKFLFGGRQ